MALKILVLSFPQVLRSELRPLFDFLVVADDLIGGLTGEDLEIQLELADLHMNSIHQLTRYAEIGGCENLTELNKIAEESQSKLDHIKSVAT